MPTGKDLKRLVRARMKKTGESYTAARAQLLTKKTVAARPAEAGRYAEFGGMSDASVKKATGCTWERWVKALDKAGAAEKSHREIAKLVAFYKTPSWWTQMVTVGYERIRGLRDRGQQRGGVYRVSKSRTFDAAVPRVYLAFATPRTRQRWLDGNATIKSATPGKRMRLAWQDGTSVIVSFHARGSAKSTVAIEHEKLPDKPAAEAMKKSWAEYFDRLAPIVERA